MTMDEGGDATEGVLHEITGIDILREWIDLDPVILDALLVERKSRDPRINAVLVPIQIDHGRLDLPPSQNIIDQYPAIRRRRAQHPPTRSESATALDAGRGQSVR